jgi:hypothetical protein
MSYIYCKTVAKVKNNYDTNKINFSLFYQLPKQLGIALNPKIILQFPH